MTSFRGLISPQILSCSWGAQGAPSASWSTKGQCSNVVLHLNESTGEFSYLRLPGQAGINKNSLDYYRGNLSVIGTMHLVRIVGNDLEVPRYGHSSGRACVVDRRIIFSRQMTSNIECRPNARHARPWYFSHTAHEAASPGCIVLRDNECGVEYIWRFPVDTQNMEQRCMQKLKRGASWVFPYELPWPPTISACLCDDATQEESDNNP